MGNHWVSEDEEWTLRDDGRLRNGIYWLEVDVVQENVRWFAEHGSDVLRIRCTVTGGSSGPPQGWTRPTAPTPETRPLFS